MWEEVCGNCGKQQSKLLEQRKQAMAAERIRAEKLLEEFEFNKAARLAKQLGEEPDLRLGHLRSWSELFAKQVQAAEREQLVRVAELLSEAAKHEQASDYPSALHAIEQIPGALMLSIPQGQNETPAEVMGRLQGKQSECKRLGKLIKERIESRQLNGLLAEVEQLLSLRPDKSDVIKLKKQLSEREAKLQQTRDEAYSQAQQLAERHDYTAALLELSRIDESLFRESEQRLRGELKAKLYQLSQLQDRINKSLASKKYSGLMDLVEEFLELRPKEQAMLALRDQLRARDAKNEAAVRNVVDLASQLRSQADFVGAISALSRIPSELESIASLDLFEECTELAECRQKAVEGLQQSLADSQFRPALTGAGMYRERIAGRGIADTEFIQLLQRCQAGLMEYERSEAQRKKFDQLLKNGRVVLKIGSVAAAVLLLLGVVFYFVISASMRTAAIKRALAAGDYAEVLRLDASNSEGLTLKFKALAISRALEAGNFEELLRLDPKNREGLALKSKAEAEAKEKAEAISRALAAGDYEAVLRVDASKLPAEAFLKLPPIKNSIGLELKLLPTGKFTMGSSEGGDETAHQGTLTRPFYLGVYEVTQEQYERVMGKNSSYFEGALNPVEQVSWEDAVEFCQKLSALPEEQAAGRVYRLPTEAEWEYACRAGSTTKYSFGDNDSQLEDHAWFGQNSGSKTHPVGEKEPNAWGLYDMHGNVWEWCSDWYGEYPRIAVSDPTGPKEGSLRVSRGGSWTREAALCRSAYRVGNYPSLRTSSLGFRLALSWPEISK
jgi:formylglycine-generating enzyme required for sulfatase activity